MSNRTAPHLTYGLDAWVSRLANAELPVLGGVMRDINRLTRARDASAAELAEVILRDAALTTKVLRVANSVHFSAGGEQLTTISRAVLKLGFRSIKAISLSVMLIDSLLRRGGRERMLEWLARGFHAAVQAELLAERVDPALKEEVFINALLMHLGDLAFWSCRDERMAALDQRLGQSRNSEAIERELLGVSLGELTARLAHVWDMDDTLQEALGDDSVGSVAVQLVRLGDEISLCSEQGWESDAMAAAVDRVAALTGLGRAEARSAVLKGAEEAAGLAVSFGASKLCHFIPENQLPAERNRRAASRADPQLQLNILRELAAMIHERVDANAMFQMIVEGMHRGIGLERVALCLLDPRKRSLVAKYALGDSGSWREVLAFSARGAQDNIAAYCLHSREVVWLRVMDNARFRHLLDTQAFDTDNALLAPLYAGARQVGLIIADRGSDGPPIEVVQYDSFCHFAQQANMGLAMLATQTAAAK